MEKIPQTVPNKPTNGASESNRSSTEIPFFCLGFFQQKFDEVMLVLQTALRCSKVKGCSLDLN